MIFCAAVSDFIPENVAEHKIQSSNELNYKLVNVPKILGKMTGNKHLCVSFKLETDKNIIHDKINGAIKNYNVDMVIGNILNNKSWVFIKHNSDTLKNVQDYEINGNVEEGIIHSILSGWKHKFA